MVTHDPDECFAATKPTVGGLSTVTGMQEGNRPLSDEGGSRLLHPRHEEWAAGLIDGEAWIGIRPPYNTTDRGKLRSCKAAACIEVEMTHKQTIILLHHIFGGWMTKIKRIRRFNHSQSWRWSANNQKCIEVLDRILPYLVTKKETAKKVIAQWSKLHHKVNR